MAFVPSLSEGGGPPEHPVTHHRVTELEKRLEKTVSDVSELKSSVIKMGVEIPYKAASTDLKVVQSEIDNFRTELGAQRRTIDKKVIGPVPVIGAILAGITLGVLVGRYEATGKSVQNPSVRSSPAVPSDRLLK